MTDEREVNDDFISFYREYARSGIHAASAALLTLFGLLSTVAGHWGFVGIGVAIYLLPIAYLYTTRHSTEPDAASADGKVSNGADGSSTPADSSNDRVEVTSETATPESDAPERAFEPTTDESEDPSTADPSATASEQSTGWRWRPRDPPTDADLVGAVSAADGTYVAGTGGILLSRRNGSWETIIEDGAGGDGNDFTAVDATSDGTAVWVVGDGGAVARIRVAEDDHVDFSAPNDLTSTWTGVAVAGQTDEETVYLANGSGIVLRGVMVDGDVRWGEGQKPGSGSSIADLDFLAPQRGVLCDTGGDVFETRDGDAFDRIGVDDPGGTLTAATASERTTEGEGDAGATSNDRSGTREVTVAADDGSLYRRVQTDWTNDRPTEAALFGLAVGHGNRLAVGRGGTILVDSGTGWEAESAPVDATLRGATLVADGTATALAVGDGGTAVERR